MDLPHAQVLAQNRPKLVQARAEFHGGLLHTQLCFDGAGMLHGLLASLWHAVRWSSGPASLDTANMDEPL